MSRRPTLSLLAAFAGVTLAIPAGASDPSGASGQAAERSASQDQPRPAKKEERRRTTGTAPCTRCGVPSTGNGPMLEAPIQGLLLIPAAFARTGVNGLRSMVALRD